MNCLERLDRAVAEAKRLISERDKNVNYNPNSYKKIINDKKAHKREVPNIEEAVIEKIPDYKIRHDGKVGIDKTEFELRTEVNTRSFLEKYETPEWGIALVDNAKTEYKNLVKEIENLKISNKTVEIGGVSDNVIESKAVGKFKLDLEFSQATVVYDLDRTDRDLMRAIKESGIDVLFKIEAGKKLKTIENIIEKSKEMILLETQKRNTVEGTFKSLLRNNTSISHELPENSSNTPSISISSDESSKQNLVKRIIDGPAGLEMVVNSSEFKKYLDRQIVSSISRVHGFKKHYEKVLEIEDIQRIVKTHIKTALRSITEAVEEEDKIKSMDEYNTLLACMSSNNDVKTENNENNNVDFQTEVGVQLAKYQNILETVIEKINKGNLECDCRFIKLINRTISRLGAYDDPVVSKMTVQFVVCKRYVEDYIEVKQAIKAFTGCDL
ncbi:hypothetical protein PAEPH01_0795 [Pancytospora epiphaga]|nr:hypothetical protein PAEPH01_0795 [Pancytospora epiphaga]